MDEDEMIGRITKLLEQGCTMLATHHSCGAPLFRCKGEIVCPVCSFGGAADEAARAESAAEVPQANQAPERPREEEIPGLEPQLQPPSQPAEQDVVERELKEAVLVKLRDLTSGLKSEQDLSKLRSQLDCLDAALRVLRSLQR